MSEYITICQNRIAYDMGVLVTTEGTEDYMGRMRWYTKLVELPINLWSAVSLRVFDAFMVKAAETTEKEWTLKITEYAELCGIEYSTALSQMQIPCNVMRDIGHPNAYGRSGFRDDGYYFDMQRIRGGYRMTAKTAFWKYAQGESTRGVMPFPKDLFKVDMKRTPMAYLYGRTLVYHKFMNLGKTNEDIIRVESICSNFGYDKKGGAFKRRLLEPFIRNMDALSEILSYEWLDGLPKNYEYFLRSRLKITWHDYPCDLKYVAKRQRHYGKR